MASRYIFRRQFSSSSILRLPTGSAAHTVKSYLTLHDTPKADGADKAGSISNDSQIKSNAWKEAETHSLSDVKSINVYFTAFENDTRTGLDVTGKLNVELKDGAQGTKSETDVVHEVRKLQDAIYKFKDEMKDRICKETQKVGNEVLEGMTKALKVQQDAIEKKLNSDRGTSYDSDSDWDRSSSYDSDSDWDRGNNESEDEDDNPVSSDEQKSSLPEKPAGYTQKQILDMLGLMNPNSSNVISGFTLANALDVVDEDNYDEWKFLNVLIERYGKDAELLPAAVRYSSVFGPRVSILPRNRAGPEGEGGKGGVADGDVANRLSNPKS